MIAVVAMVAMVFAIHTIKQGESNNSLCFLKLAKNEHKIIHSCVRK